MNDKEVTLVTINGKPVSVGVGRFCFSIEDDKVADNSDQRVGSVAKGQSARYNEAFELAQFAWDNQIFDAVEKH